MGRIWLNLKDIFMQKKTTKCFLYNWTHFIVLPVNSILILNTLIKPLNTNSKRATKLNLSNIT